MSVSQASWSSVDGDGDGDEAVHKAALSNDFNLVKKKPRTADTDFIVGIYLMSNGRSMSVTGCGGSCGVSHLQTASMSTKTALDWSLKSAYSCQDLGTYTDIYVQANSFFVYLGRIMCQDGGSSKKVKRTVQAGASHCGGWKTSCGTENWRNNVTEKCWEAA